MAEVKDDKKNEEKTAEYSKKVKLYVLVLLGILVFGLILSMFKTSSSPKTPPPVRNNKELVMTGDDFAAQEEFQRNQLNAQRLKGGKGAQYYGDDDDPQWENKEKVRALDSRASGFGLDDKKKLQTASYQSNIAAFNQAQLQQTSSLNSTSEPGANIIGREVDDSYPGKQSGDSVLVPTGTVVDGVLDQDVMSDYIGPWSGHFIQDVYSVDNQFILLPKGTKVTGQSLHIPNVNEPIQNRMGLTVEWAILPNGKRIDFRKNTPEDQAGVAAFAGDVNRHILAQFMSVAAYALISASGPRDNYNQYGYVQPTFSGQLADGSRAALTPYLMKYLSLVPTVTLHAGTPVKVFLQDDMYVKPWARVNTTVY